MRIVIHAGYARSIVNFRGELIKELLKSGAEVHAVAPGLSYDLAARKQLEEMGVVIHDIDIERTGVNPLKDIKAVCHLYCTLRKIKSDAIFSYTIKPVVYGLIAARLAKIPNRYALITGLGYAFIGEARGKRWVVQRLAQRLYSVALKHATVIFFQNSDDKDLFMEKGLITRNMRTKVVNGSGIDITRFCVADLPLGPPRFLLIARLLGDKGVREYVSAAARLKERYPEIKVRLVGGIDSNPDAITQAELDGWLSAGHVEYLGRLTDVRPAIADATVYVLPSYREGTPRTVLEAMAMGRPIITTDAPGCRETVVPGVNGLLVPVKSVDALVSAMEQFIIDPFKAPAYGKRSRQIAEEKYDVRKVNAAMLQEMEI